MRATLRQWERRDLGRTPSPLLAAWTPSAARRRLQTQNLGFDGNTKIQGRTRPILVDPLGLSMAVGETSADPEDRLGVVSG